MKITILNGSPSQDTFDQYLGELESLLKPEHQVNIINLREEDIKYCIGCFGCWVRTPGVCSCADGSCNFREAVIQSDFTLWAAPLKMGFPHHLLKMSLDKSIPLVHPYIIVDIGEAHHLPRYEKYPRFGLLVGKETDTDSEDLNIVQEIFSRTAINIKSWLEFCLTTDENPKIVAEKIVSQQPEMLPNPKYKTATTGETVHPPKHITIFNGSPRGKKGNTPIMLKQFAEGFTSKEGNTASISHLIRIQDHPEFVEQFANAECVWIGFPLYTDAMPGLVKTFIEALEPFKDRPDNPPIGFVVQSGFPEALHSRFIEQYLQKLANRLNAPYLGTIVKGGGEGLRMLPEKSTAKLFANLQSLGEGFARSGSLDPKTLKPIAGTERYHPLLRPIFKLFVKLPMANWYFDSQLKDNDAYEDRFAQPYKE